MKIWIHFLKKRKKKEKKERIEKRNVFLEIHQEVKENKFGLKKIVARLLYYDTFM